MERKVNAGYHIFWEGDRRAAGYSPTAPDPFVLWDNEMPGEYRNGRYKQTLDAYIYEVPAYSPQSLNSEIHRSFNQYMAETFAALNKAEDVLGEIREHAKKQLIMAASNVNLFADSGDINRNHTNYGIVTQCIHTLWSLGEEIEVPVYEKELGVLRIPSVSINGEVIELEDTNSEQKKIKDFQVIEDNGGGLSLAVFGEEGDLEYLHNNYEYHSQDLKKDLVALMSGDDTKKEWDGNSENMQEDYDWLKRGLPGGDMIGASIVADNNGIYPDRMEGIAREAFEITDEDEGHAIPISSLKEEKDLLPEKDNTRPSIRTEMDKLKAEIQNNAHKDAPVKSDRDAR